jgi:hypothetical protein
MIADPNCGWYFYFVLVFVSPSVDGSAGVVEARPFEITWLFENELFFEVES